MSLLAALLLCAAVAALWPAVSLMAAPAGPPPRRSAPPFLGGLMGHFEHRRDQIERINDMLIKPTRVSGFQEIAFVGEETTQELLVDVVFPVWFVDIPAMSFGAHLVRDLVEEGFFPTVSVVVVGWTKAQEIRPGGGYFIGARLAVVASGREQDRMVIHWNAEAKALRIAGGGS